MSSFIGVDPVRVQTVTKIVLREMVQGRQKGGGGKGWRREKIVQF